MVALILLNVYESQSKLIYLHSQHVPSVSISKNSFASNIEFLKSWLSLAHPFQHPLPVFISKIYPFHCPEPGPSSGSSMSGFALAAGPLSIPSHTNNHFCRRTLQNQTHITVSFEDPTLLIRGLKAAYQSPTHYLPTLMSDTKYASLPATSPPNLNPSSPLLGTDHWT